MFWCCCEPDLICPVGATTETFDSTTFTPSTLPELQIQAPSNYDTVEGFVKRPGQYANVTTTGGRVRAGQPSNLAFSPSGFGICKGRPSPLDIGYTDRVEITLTGIYPSVPATPSSAPFDTHEVVLEISYIAHVKVWWVDYGYSPQRWRYYIQLWWSTPSDWPAGYPSWEIATLELPIKLSLTAVRTGVQQANIKLHVNDTQWYSVNPTLDYNLYSSDNLFHGVRYSRYLNSYWYEFDDWVSYSTP